MVDVGAGLKYPLRGDSTLKLHAIGGGVPVLLNVVTFAGALAGVLLEAPLLLVLPFVVLFPFQLAIGILWTGYFVRIARDTFEGGTEPPAWGDWGELASEGFWGFLIVLAYQIPGIVLMVGGYALMFLFIFGASFGARQGSESAAATAGIVGVVLMLLVFLVAMVYSVAITYLLPISLVAYADEGRVGAAFSLDTLKTVGADGEYVKPWAASVGVYMAVATLVSFLTAILIGYLLVPFLPLLYFYIGTAAFYMFAQAYADTTGKTIPSTGTADEAVGTASADGVGTRSEDV